VATQYRVICDCGRTHHVSGGDAGSRLPCGCGRTIDVPELHTLRTSVGEPTISPELAIELLLRDRQIPGDGACLCCGLATENICHVQVECERPEVKRIGWTIVPFMFVFGVVAGLLALLRTKEQIHGRYVCYRLPIRMCSACTRSVSRSEVSTALRQIDVYRQLLDKYPHASVGHLEC